MKRLLSKLTSLSVVSALLISSPGLAPYQAFAEALKPVRPVSKAAGGLPASSFQLKTSQFVPTTPETRPFFPALQQKLDSKLEAVRKASQEFSQTPSPSDSEAADFKEKSFKELRDEEKSEVNSGVLAEPLAGPSLTANHGAPKSQFSSNNSVSDTELSQKTKLIEEFGAKVSPRPPSSFIRGAMLAGLGIAVSILTQDWTPAGVSLAMAPFGFIAGFHPEQPFRERAGRLREKIGAFMVSNFEAGKEISPSKLESLEKELVSQGYSLHEIGTEQRFLLQTPLASGLVRIKDKIYLTTKKTEMDPSYWGKAEEDQFNREWSEHKDVISSEFSKIYSLSKALEMLREDNLQAYDYAQAGEELEKAVLKLESIRQNKIISSLPASVKFIEGLKEMAVSTLQILKENKLHPRPPGALSRLVSFIKNHPWTSLSSSLNFGAGYLLGGMHAAALGAGLANLAVAAFMSSGISAVSSSSKAKNASRFFLYTAVSSFAGNILGFLFPSAISARIFSFLEAFKSTLPDLLTAGPSSYQVQLAGFGLENPYVYSVFLAAAAVAVAFQAGRWSTVKTDRPRISIEPLPSPWVQAAQFLQRHRGFLGRSKPYPPLEITVPSLFSGEEQKIYGRQLVEEAEIVENPDYDFLKTLRLSAEITYSDGFRVRSLESEQYHFDFGTGRPYLRHSLKYDLKGKVVEDNIVELALDAPEEELRRAENVRENWVRKILLLKSQQEELRKNLLPWWKALFSAAAFAALSSLQSPEAAFAAAMAPFAVPGPPPQSRDSKGLLPWKEVMSSAVQERLELKGENFTEYLSYVNTVNGLLLLIYRRESPPQGPIRENVYYFNKEGALEQVESSLHDPGDPEGPYLENNIHSKDSIPSGLAASAEELKESWIELVSLLVHVRRVLRGHQFGQEISWEGYKAPVLQMGYSRERLEELEELLKLKELMARVEDRFYYTGMSVLFDPMIRAEKALIEAHPELANAVGEDIEYFKKSIRDYLFKEGWKKPLSTPVQEAPKYFEEVWAKFFGSGLKEYSKIPRALSEASRTFLRLGLRQAAENYLSERYQPASPIDLRALHEHFTGWRYPQELIVEAVNLLILEKVLVKIGDRLYFMGQDLDPGRLGLSWKQEPILTNVMEASGLLDLFVKSPLPAKAGYLNSLLSWTRQKKSEVSKNPRAASYFDKLSQLARAFLKLGILAALAAILHQLFPAAPELLLAGAFLPSVVVPQPWKKALEAEKKLREKLEFDSNHGILGIKIVENKARKNYRLVVHALGNPKIPKRIAGVSVETKRFKRVKKGGISNREVIRIAKDFAKSAKGHGKAESHYNETIALVMIPSLEKKGATPEQIGLFQAVCDLYPLQGYGWGHYAGD